ncbi:glycosyltransferase family 4 protein [bacterium]|nr:glycosyltransferase family 4 protein [bacterium]
MRILFLNHNEIWRSTFYRCFHLGRYLVRQGHEVTLYTIHPKHRFGIEEIELEGVRVVQFPDLFWGMGRSGWDIWDVWYRLRRVRKEIYDLVHAFDSRPVVIHPALAVRKKGIPLVMDWADWWGRGGVIEERSNKLIKLFVGGIETWYEEHFRTQALGTTVISSALQERAIGLGVKPETIIKITGGADVENFKPQDKQKARAALGISQDAKILGFMGFVHYDLDLALQVFCQLHQQDPKVKLILVGKPAPMAKRIARQHGAEAGLLEYGIVPYDKIPEYMCCADVFLLPFARKQANLGRWPNKVGDYMAMGRPIVSSPVGEMESLFATEQIGRLAPEQPEAFAQVVEELLSDPQSCERLGQAARQAAVKRYSWEFLAQRLEQFYLKILQA